MANVLFIKANDRPSEAAISVQMYEQFLKNYREAHPHDTITELDLYKENLPYFGNTAMTGLYKLSNGIEPTPEEKEIADIANRYLDQFMQSNKIVIAFPLWNYTVPAPLVTYISYLMRVGVTFRYTAEGPVGLAADKKTALLNARGGDYSLEAMAPMEMSLNLVKASLSLMGITDPTCVVIEGHAMYQDQAQEIIQKGLRATAGIAANF